MVNKGRPIPVALNMCLIVLKCYPFKFLRKQYIASVELQSGQSALKCASRLCLVIDKTDLLVYLNTKSIMGPDIQIN